MQVVFFEGTEIRDLQGNINTWFKAHPNLASVNIIQNVTPGRGTDPDTILISLWYQEAPGPPLGQGKVVPSRFMQPVGPWNRLR